MRTGMPTRAHARIYTLPTILLREEKENKHKKNKDILGMIVDRKTIMQPSCTLLPEDIAAACLFALLSGLWLLAKAVAIC